MTGVNLKSDWTVGKMNDKMGTHTSWWQCRSSVKQLLCILLSEAWWHPCLASTLSYGNWRTHK